MSTPEIESMRTVAAGMRRQINHQTKLIEDARYIIEAMHRGADVADYGREINDWLDELNKGEA